MEDKHYHEDNKQEQLQISFHESPAFLQESLHCRVLTLLLEELKAASLLTDDKTWSTAF